MACIRTLKIGGLLLALQVFVTGCTHLGPSSVVRDRFSYASAISGYTLVCRDGDPESYRMIEAPGRIQKSGGVGIRSGTSQPPEVFAAVPYRGHWFWIEDEDFPSKRLFSLLMFFFTLTEQGGKA